MRSLHFTHPRFHAIAIALLAFAVLVLLLFRTADSDAADGNDPDRSPPPIVQEVPVAAAPVRADESVRGRGTSRMARRKRGEYAGPLVVVDRAGTCPRVARQFMRMRTAAARDRIYLHVTSGFRTRLHQARLYRELGPQWAARPGKTLHHDATELDIRMMPGAGNPTHVWLTRHARFFGFVQRYSWEPWHWGFVRGC